MNKAFEKIIENIENLKLPFPDECPSYYGNTNKLLDATKEIVQEVAEEFATDTNVGTNSWIPCIKRYPDNDNYVLLSFENYSVPCVGRYEENENGGAFYIGDERRSCVSQDMFVNAWQPLPESYRESEQNDGNL